MSVPVGCNQAVRLSARFSLASLSYGFLQLFYVLLRPSYSAPCPPRDRLIKSCGFLLSALLSLGNLLVGLAVMGRDGNGGNSVYDQDPMQGGSNEDVVQGAAAVMALFHGGLYWAYTRIPRVFLPFTYINEVFPRQAYVDMAMR